MAAPAFPSKAQLEAELAAEQSAAIAAVNAPPPRDRIQGALASSSSERSDNGGPSELTLIAYSAFMGLSSLIFGGLTLLQARNVEGEDSKPLSFPEMLIQSVSMTFSRLVKRFVAALTLLAHIDIKDVFPGILILLCVLVFAHATKPTDASFRNYLTDLSLHQHLRHIKDQQKGVAASKPPEQPLPSDQASPHVLTFANRISISLRTPPYVRHDYALFSIVMVSHPPMPCGCAKDACATAHRPRNSWYVGVFGKWWHGASEVLDAQQTSNGSEVAKKKKGGASANGKAADYCYGVLEMKTGDADDRRRGSQSERENTLSPTQTPAANAKSAKRKPKNSLRLRASQNTAPPTAAARSTAIAAQRNLADDAPSTVPSSNSSSALAHAEEPASTPPESKDAAAVSTAIEDLRSQIASLKGSTDSTQQQLQAQLEELRTRKKDDDAARADLKGRMKTLDEGKRSAEAAKREAEKRLKAAQQVRDGLQKRAEASRSALASFQDRHKASGEKLARTLEQGAKRRAEIEKEMGEKQQAVADADKLLGEMKLKVEQLEKSAQEEQDKVKAAEASLQARISARAQQAAAAAAAYQAQQQQQHASPFAHYAHAGLPADQMAPAFHPTQYAFPDDEQWARNGGADFDDPYYAPFVSQTTMGRRASEDQFGRANFQPFGVSAADAYQHGGGGGGGFDSSPFAQDSAALAYHTPRHQRSLADLASNGGAGGNLPPVSPFSTDLLPSNLFQSIEDESHPGVRSRSDTIEAAMGRFGLDSDHSDVGDGNQSDRDTVDGVLDGELQPLSEHESEDEVAAQAQAAAAARARGGVKPVRSWWGSSNGGAGRRGVRQTSSDRALGDVAAAARGAVADDDDDEEVNGSGDVPAGKRKSFGVFPRLLNPGARAFRSASRKQADADALRGLQPNGFGSEGYLGPPGARAGVDANVVGGSSAAAAGSTHFDAVLRAFEASNAPDEEEGRRSWSAFDQWNQRQGLPSRLGHHERTPSGGALGAAGNGNASPIIPSGLGQESFNGWSEDLFQPLGRTSSAGASIQSSTPSQPDIAATASAAAAPNASSPASTSATRNRSRFAFWSGNTKGSLNSVASSGLSSSEAGGSRDRLSTSSSDAPGANGQSDDVFADSNESAQLGTSPASITSQSRPEASLSSSASSGKRRSFRWPKRQNSSSGTKTSGGSTAAAVGQAEADVAEE